MKLPNVGDRLVVHGIDYAKATVKSVSWTSLEARWCITLDWGSYGTSRVYGDDENKTWFRYGDVN